MLACNFSAKKLRHKFAQHEDQKDTKILDVKIRLHSGDKKTEQVVDKGLSPLDWSCCIDASSNEREMYQI